jgi:hypothetical protein
VVTDYCAQNSITHVVVIAPEQYMTYFGEATEENHVTYANAIEYRYFYRLLQEIGPNSLVVINECLRTQNRYDLTYNCIRNFLNQTNHWLIFQYLPQIDTKDDFMILFDFATHSRWKRMGYDAGLIHDNVTVRVKPATVTFNRIDVPTCAKTKERYAKEREKLFASIGDKDPHTLPRNLYLIGGGDKLAHANSSRNGQMALFDKPACNLVARNQRLACDNLSTYQAIDPAMAPFTILEFPHRFIDFSDFLYEARQTVFDVLVADLKVDNWYWQRFTEWKDRLNETYSSLQQK